MSQTKLIVLATVLLFFCATIAFAGGLGLGIGLSDAFKPTVALTSDPDPTAAAYQPVERPAPREDLALEDDFSQEWWDVYRDDKHHKGYENGQYYIVVDATDFSYWSVAGVTMADLVLEVETNQVDGPDNNDFGVILRYQDDDNFYSFEISGDGYYTFGKLVEGQFFSIIPWRESRSINLGNNPNLLRVEAIGPNFSLYINDDLVDAAIDSEFDQGDIGLLVGTYEEAGAHITFDNLKVWRVE